MQWAHSTNVSEVIFTGLAKYQEIAVFGKAITLSAEGSRFWQARAVGDSAWIEGNGKYTYFDINGAESDLHWGTTHFTASASARGFNFRVAPWGVAGAKKIITGPLNCVLEDTRVLDAIRFFAQSGDFSTARNYTGGAIQLWGRIA